MEAVRRRGDSPWWLEDRQKIRFTTPTGVAHSIATGDHPLWAWQIDRCYASPKLSRLTGIEYWHLIEISAGREPATTAEVDAIAAALLVEPELLQRQVVEFELNGSAQALRSKVFASDGEEGGDFGLTE